MWHAQTQTAREQGKLVLLGVIQEQHADRCRLFAQWQEFDWTILHDPINQLAAQAVPIFVAIDEAGVVVDANLQTDELEAFLARATPSIAVDSPPPVDVTQGQSPDDEILWSPAGQLSSAIAGYRAEIASTPEAAHLHFRLGVALRMRHDSDFAKPGDFQAAVTAWGRALELNPNQYIYRRRIQQYGPRLIKPYPFYDWVNQAREEITTRGEVPLELNVEPSGAEFAEPTRSFVADAAPQVNPDPQGRITRDTKLIATSVVAVPAKVAPGESIRIHLEMKPVGQAHWNNEVDPMLLWIDAPPAWRVEKAVWSYPQPAQPESQEVRRMEFEVHVPEGAQSRTLSAYALYYVCNEASGQCLYRRQDIALPLNVSE